MNEAAEKIAPVHAGQRSGRVASSGSDGGRVWRLEVERPVRPPVDVVAHIDPQDVVELAAADDQEPVYAFAADAADPALDVSVRVRSAPGPACG